MIKILLITCACIAALSLKAQKGSAEIALQYNETKTFQNRYGEEVNRKFTHAVAYFNNYLKHTSRLKTSVYYSTITNLKEATTKAFITDSINYYQMDEEYIADFLDLGQYTNSTPVISYLQDTLTIKNILCSKALLNFTLNGENCTMEVWYANNHQLQLNGVKSPFAELGKLPVKFTFIDKPKMMIKGINNEVKCEYLLDTMYTPMLNDVASMPNKDKYVEISGGEKLVKMMEIMQNKQIKLGNTSITSPKGTPITEKVATNDSLTSLTLTRYNPFRIGDKLANFSGITADGIQRNLSDFKNKVVVINFWFIKCAPCILEMPILNKIAEKFQNKEVSFLGITFDKSKEVNAFLKQTKFNFEKIVEASSIIENLAVSSYPTTIIIDKNGIVRFVKLGSFSSEEELEKEIIKILE